MQPQLLHNLHASKVCVSIIYDQNFFCIRPMKKTCYHYFGGDFQEEQCTHEPPHRKEGERSCGRK